MPFDEGLAERLRDVFRDQPPVEEKKMFGGLAFMLNGNMCCGIIGETLMARVGPEQYETLLTEKYAREMDFTGRSMKGFLYIDPEGIESDEDLKAWVSACLVYITSLPHKS
jgi:hypothetical protein